MVVLTMGPPLVYSRIDPLEAKDTLFPTGTVAPTRGVYSPVELMILNATPLLTATNACCSSHQNNPSVPVVDPRSTHGC